MRLAAYNIPPGARAISNAFNRQIGGAESKFLGIFSANPHLAAVSSLGRYLVSWTDSGSFRQRSLSPATGRTARGFRPFLRLDCQSLSVSLIQPLPTDGRTVGPLLIAA